MDREEGKWEYTDYGKDVLSQLGEFEERELPEGEKAGFFQERRLITRDSPINDGVYVCLHQDLSREAVVVDDKKQKKLGEVYQKLLRRRERAQQRGETFKKGVLPEVFNLVLEILPYDREKAEQVVSGSVKIGRKVALEIFIENQAGVCRHQALLVAYLLERLKREGKIHPQSISVDRNFIVGKGGHAWVRYVNSVGEIFIIDPAKHFIGKLDDPKRPDWPYERPEEVERKKTI